MLNQQDTVQRISLQGLGEILLVLMDVAIPVVPAGGYSGMPFTRQIAVDSPKILMLKAVFLQR